MLKAETGTSVVISGLILVWAHMIALRYSLYWHYSWFDSIVHFIGGLMAGFLVAFLVVLVREELAKKRETYSLIILFGTLAIGIIWEVFEHFFNITFDPVYSFDTALDIICDLAGGLVAIGVTNLFVLLSNKRKLPRGQEAVESLASMQN